LHCKFVIGKGAALESAIAAWRETDPTLELRPVSLEQDSSYLFDLAALDGLTAADASAFVAFDDQFLNFRRFELMGQLKSRGFSMPPLICRGALVSSSAIIGENVLVGPGAIVDHGCRLDFNAVIGAGANIGSSSRIGSSAWIEAGVVIGRGAKIGANATIGLGVIVGDSVDIGKLSVVDVPGKITQNIASKTFIHQSFDMPITIVE
jgi:UDP-3-O-[3-hydroxymyristoyl] glucosamine N-acyltransferase